MILQYYKLEQRDNFDMKATRTVYKLKTKQRYSGKEFVKMVAHRHGFSETIIEGVLLDVASELELLLGEGATVTVPGIGSFSLGIRLSEERKQQLEEEQEAAAEAEEAGKRKKPKVTEPNAVNLELHHINFRLDKDLFQEVKNRFRKQKLQRIYGKEGSRITIDDKKQSERIAAAHRFLAKNTFMHIADYAEVTGLSYSSAQRELNELVKFKHSGITSQGLGSHRVWMLAK